MSESEFQSQSLAPLRLSTAQIDFDQQFKKKLAVDAELDMDISARVEEILYAVKKEGDVALLRFTNQFDHRHVSSASYLEIPKHELKAAFESISQAQRDALEFAAQRVRIYHEKQKEACGNSWFFKDEEGSELGQKVSALDKVGIYVPGGKAAYPSSVLMNAIPAHVAGVYEIIMVVPTPHDEKNTLVMAAAYLAGVSRVFTIGGAQAIAALAYGTETIPAVDKIVGPGNAYVAEAKRRVFGKVGIDMIAGPSEILVISDGSAPVEWVAMDLFSQAEHDELAQSIFLCPDANYIDQVQSAMDRMLPSMPRHAIIKESINSRGMLIHTKNMEEACEIANRVAPEHLEIASLEAKKWEPLLHHAGAIFVGIYATESMGDYCAGPNHVLPTSGTARFSSPLGVYDFQKRTSILKINALTGAKLAEPTKILAEGEGLQAHARAAMMRSESEK